MKAMESKREAMQRNCRVARQVAIDRCDSPAPLAVPEAGCVFEAGSLQWICETGGYARRADANSQALAAAPEGKVERAAVRRARAPLPHARRPSRVPSVVLCRF
ncbi:unnamed protein product [Pieris brassicae]|uniref:Uncharacterized protein n=2 Tax=Pieris brassicae TaxID=7116 RepID=A0A9P0XEG8_PIEBR|nr:unnamed protein product [Pieris brassicae]